MERATDFTFNEKLREVPCSSKAMLKYVEELRVASISDQSLPSKAKLLGEMGVYLRILGKLDDAEACLRKSLRTIQENALGSSLFVQQTIRLANTLQWKKNYSQSNALFTEVIAICRKDTTLDLFMISESFHIFS